jgi:hypothetical protein
MRCIFHRGRKAARVQRIASFFSFVLATAISASAARVPPSSTTALVFDFSRPISDSVWLAVVTTLARANLSGLLGHPVLLVQREQVSKGTEFLDVVQVALSGDCAAGRDFDSSAGRGPLGWVYLVSGRIQPFIFVDCNQIARNLRRELQDRPGSERKRAMACAVSNVIVHELAHIVTQDPGHTKTGPQKGHATQLDLLSGVREIAQQSIAEVLPLRPCPADASTSAVKGVHRWTPSAQ